MFEKMSQIELSGISYPIKCDVVVLEQLQDMFGSIEEFEEGLLDWEYEYDENNEKIEKIIGEKENKKKVFVTKYKFPKAKHISAAVFFMVNEGMEISGKEAPFTTIKDAARAIDAPVFRVSEILHSELLRSLTRKNVDTTQVEM